MSALAFPGPRTVLVVDDYPALLAWATRAFQRAGWTVLSASDGHEALALWTDAERRGLPVTLLVTDFGLPGLDGAALARSLRVRNATLPVIAITGQADHDGAWSGMLLNYTVFFHKPVRAAELVAAAEALVRPAALPDEEPCPVEPAA